MYEGNKINQLTEKLEQLEILQTITDTIPGVVFQLYVESTGEAGLRYVSPRLHDVFGLELINDAPLLLQQFEQNIFEEDRGFWIKRRQEAEQSLTQISWEGRYALPSGDTIWFEVQATPKKQGNETIFNGILSEITDRKEMELELVEAQRIAEEANKSKSAFLADISHELRTPMHGILNYADFGIRRISKAPKEKILEYFHEIAGSGNRLMTLINDLLDLAKLESGRMNYVMAEQDLNKIIITMAHEFHPILIQKSQELKVAGPEMTLMTALDIDRISQVLRNLLSNSVKFSDEGSEIVIRAKEETVKLEDREQTFLNVSVTDRGAGIPEQELEDVFDKFIQSTKTQTVSGGTGLGLAISKQIIEDHDGKIWAENNPDGGAIFCFSIPKRSVVNVAD